MGEQHRAQVFDHLLPKLARISPRIDRRVNHAQSFCRVSVDHRFDQFFNSGAAGGSQHLLDQRQRDRLVRVSYDLIQQADAVAHAACAIPCDHFQSGALSLQALAVDDPFQTIRRLVDGEAPELELQAAALDCRGHFIDLGGRQHEDRVFRRFFQCLEQGIERAAAETVHFVDDVNFELSLTRRKRNFFAQVAHIINTRVRRSINLDQVEVASFVDGDTRGALVTWADVDIRVLAVQGFCQQARGRRLARAAWSAEQIGVPHPPGFQGVAQGARDMFLPDHVFERHRSPLQI